jgi:hypothetical protein
VNDVRAQAPEESRELHDAERIVDRRQLAAYVSQRKEGDADPCSRLLERPISVCCQGDVEPLPGRRVDEVTDVRLRTADLGERDDKEDEWSRAADARRVVEPGRRLEFGAVNATAMANARRGAGR